MRAFKENREGNKLILTVFRCRWCSTNKWPVSENKSQNSNYKNFRILSRRILCCFFHHEAECFVPYSVQFSRSVVSDSLRPHELQHARPPCPSPTPRVHSNARPSSRWCHPAISSSVVPFSSCPQSLPASVFSSESTLHILHIYKKSWLSLTYVLFKESISVTDTNKRVFPPTPYSIEKLAEDHVFGNLAERGNNSHSIITSTICLAPKFTSCQINTFPISHHFGPLWNTGQ